MRVSRSVTRYLAGVGAWSAALVLLSCSPSDPTDPEQLQGHIEVNVSTQGAGAPSAYAVNLDGNSPQSIEVDGSVTLGPLAAGDYAVALVVPANCSVSPASTRSVAVQEGRTSTVSFTVNCSALPTGAIGVTTVTSGDAIDADGYTVSVDGGTGQAIGVDGTLLIPDLVVGTHDVIVDGVSDNCLVQGENPRALSVSENTTTQTTFEVVCSSTTGLIAVSVTTTGAEPDADGYTVVLDGDLATQPVASTGSTTFTGVEAGDHTLTLGDVASNCTVSSANNPASATVAAGQTTDVSFAVDCAATVGGLNVSVSSTGSEVDPNGYSASVDGGAGQAIGVNGTLSFPDLGAGPHEVELTGVSANCAVGGENPRTVDVVAGQTAATTFDVICSSTVGAIEVNVATSGAAPDNDGYTVRLEGGGTQPIGSADGSTTFTGLAPGDYTVHLQNIAANCDATSANPASTPVTAGNTSTVNFAVECEELTGNIQVAVETTGDSRDPDGYTVSVSGAGSEHISTDGSRFFSDVAIGEHEVEITGEAGNCTVQGANPRTVTVNNNSTTPVDFDVVCSATMGSIHVSVERTGDEQDTNFRVLLVGEGEFADLDLSNGFQATFSNLTPGDYDLRLENIAANCSVQGGDTQSANVNAGQTEDVEFTVDCHRTTGEILVSNTTTGSPPDPDGYTIQVSDGGGSGHLPVDGDVLFEDLEPGDYDVTISDVADQCDVTGGDLTRTVTVNEAQETPITFTVTCAPLTGNIQVDVTTTGVELDPNGYSAQVDGGPGQPVGPGPTGSTTFDEVLTGTRQVSLSGVAANCTVDPPSPQPVTVSADATEIVAFTVTCSSTTGSIEVDVSTTGDDPDLGGYMVLLDGESGQPANPNDTVTFAPVTSGPHTVELTQFAANCSVSSPNPFDTEVTAASTSNVNFVVTCTSTTGDLEVTAATTGTDFDGNGYVVTLDGGTSQGLGTNATVPFPDLPLGGHTVVLSDVAANCTVAGGLSRSPTVISSSIGPTTEVFNVNCVPAGDLRVTANSSGIVLDLGGYTVTVGGDQRTIGANGDTVTFAALPAGNHTVVLGSLDLGCTTPEPSRVVVVPAGGVHLEAFDVTCPLGASEQATVSGASVSAESHGSPRASTRTRGEPRAPVAT